MWLGERTEISLHPYQLACLMLIVKVCFNGNTSQHLSTRSRSFSFFDFDFFLSKKTHGSFELQGVPEKDLNSQLYASMIQRLHVRS
jgi:hypothetical protein